MKKQLLCLTVLASLMLSLAACSGDTDTQDNTSEPPVSSPSASQDSAADPSDSQPSESDTSDQEDSSDSDLPTLEEFFNSDMMQAMVSAFKEQYEAEGIQATMYAQGDELWYEFTLADELTEEDRSYFAEALQTSIGAEADTYLNSAAQMKSAVSNDVVIIVVSCLDGAGNELFSQSFSSADAAQ